MKIELIKGNTYIIKSITNIGIYKLNAKEIYLIDTGATKEIAQELLDLLIKENLSVKGIINTHSHVDHIQGNKLIQDYFKCKIYINNEEKSMIENTLIEPTCLLGCKPTKNILKYWPVQNSKGTDINNLPDIFESIPLYGHSIGQTGIRTKDNVLFIGDALINADKIKIGYIYDIDEYINTINKLKEIKADYYVPSHTDIYEDIDELININLESINNLEKLLLNIINNKSLEDILKTIFDYGKIKFNIIQYNLISVTIKSYLNKLLNENKITMDTKENKIIYKLL